MDESKAKPSAGLKETAKKAPASPGVYIWRDPDGVPLYVGKARSLRDRLASYFLSKRDAKTRLLVSKASSLESILTETEYEELGIDEDFHH